MRGYQRLRATFGVAVLAVVIGASTPLPATAAVDSDAPDSGAAHSDAQWWADAYGVDAAHAAGLTGAGVKVAVIEKQINPDLPVFEGTNLTISDKSVCAAREATVTSEITPGSNHGTTMTAMIIGNGAGGGGVRGMAPDADVTFYGLGPAGECEQNDRGGLSEFGFLVKNAVDDGARVIMTAVGITAADVDAPAVAYALSRGVAIVAALQNPTTGGDPKTDITGMNGVIAVSAIDTKGELQKTEDGNPYVVPETTVVAAGCCLPTVGSYDGGWSGSTLRQGSSYASPTVAGMLTLAVQKYPQATGNQLVHALLASTNGGIHDPVRAEDGYGYGAAWLPTLLQTDPSIYPDETPLMQGPVGTPTAEQIASARANGFTPLDTTRKSTFDADAARGTTFDMGALVPWVISGVITLLVIAAAITTVIVITQRRKTRERNAP
ncbi:S8 family serine peptidase [Microbacterium sp. NPDC090007]|uniref:S8 family serine peptidase n=1 Tax=Microbacterium sp. NPDC090007 TaxID=3364204 RepID=UPI0037F4EC7B